jgi:hypothetical protein
VEVCFSSMVAMWERRVACLRRDRVATHLSPALGRPYTSAAASVHPILDWTMIPYSVLVRKARWVGGSQPGRRRSKATASSTVLQLGRRGSQDGIKSGLASARSMVSV